MIILLSTLMYMPITSKVFQSSKMEGANHHTSALHSTRKSRVAGIQEKGSGT